MRRSSGLGAPASGGRVEPHWRGLLRLVGWICVILSGVVSGHAAVGIQYVFRNPEPVIYEVDAVGSRGARPAWVTARLKSGAGERVDLGDRIVLGLEAGASLDALLAGRPLALARTIGDRLFILQAADALSALDQAAQLAAARGVHLCHPVQRRSQVVKHEAYSTRPNDPYFGQQWNFENRDANGARQGPDLNARAAWAISPGAGVVIAIVDDGVELTHPDLAPRSSNAFHFNFGNGTTNALPGGGLDIHATAVAGLAAAQANNRRGMSGMAPEAGLASWKIFDGDRISPSDEGMMDMFQYRTQEVAVQNHSWGNGRLPLLAPTALERIGISNALSFGRGGRGVIMVRSAGNGGEELKDVNDDGFANDPRVIAVAAIRRDGRVAPYSSPGACVLVAAPGGGTDRALFTTDRTGNAGFNSGIFTNDFADYVASPFISGTSFSAPQISGLAALMLSVNPALAIRDVQQILMLSARHHDAQDPDLRTNGAGLWVSHHLGFGVPDAGQAVALARQWSNRPPVSMLVFSNSMVQNIPDEGLRVSVSGTDVPGDLVSIPASPGMGLHPDEPTVSAPLIDVGTAADPIPVDLRGKAALIRQDGIVEFAVKLAHAAQAGAEFAVIYHGSSGGERYILGGTSFSPLPAVMIDNGPGIALRARIDQDPALKVQLRADPTRTVFTVTNTLILEHIGLGIQTTHPRRGDLRVTLVSPGGTRSILQRPNFDTSAGPVDWTYHSTRHFLESSAGEWTVSVTDEGSALSGTVIGVQLVLRGVPIVDTDRDGLDDEWESLHFGGLASGPADDPDGDGEVNSREFLAGSNPAVIDRPLRLDFALWSESIGRLSWPGVGGGGFEVLAASQAAGSWSVVTNLARSGRDMEWLFPLGNSVNRFFQIQTTP